MRVRRHEAERLMPARLYVRVVFFTGGASQRAGRPQGKCCAWPSSCRFPVAMCDAVCHHVQRKQDRQRLLLLAHQRHQKQVGSTTTRSSEMQHMTSITAHATTHSHAPYLC